MVRVRVYIDGFNLFYGMRAAKLKEFFWLDLVALSAALLEPGQTLDHVHYFTARILSDGNNTDDLVRQNTYLDALATCSELTIHEGNFKARTRKCRGPGCSHEHTAYEEKMSDVNLAIQMVADAYEGAYDAAIVISGDNDLAPPVRLVRGRFHQRTVSIAFPPLRARANELKQVATRTIQLSKGILSQNQLANPTTTATGVELYKPATWVAVPIAPQPKKKKRRRRRRTPKNNSA